MSTYGILKNFFADHPPQATSLTALVMQIILEEPDKEEREKCLKFLRRDRSASVNHRLLNNVTKQHVIDFEFLGAASGTRTKSQTEKAVSFQNFQNSDSEKAFLEKFYQENGVIIATGGYAGGDCYLIDEDKEVIGGRFIENGRAYEATIRHTWTEDCDEVDEFGRPNGDRIEHTTTTETTEITWRDGNTQERPPKVPDDFKPVPWNNKCPFFDGVPNLQITSDWGWRNLEGASNFHGGMDIDATAGTEVRAIETGEIVNIASGNSGGANGVKIRVGNQIHNYCTSIQVRA